jgi:hypothetical protein
MTLLSSFYCTRSYLCDITAPSLTRFGECFQWGYWTRPRSAEGCFAAPGVRVSHSPALAFSALIDKACYRDILIVLRGRVQNASIFRAAIESPPFFFCGAYPSYNRGRFSGVSSTRFRRREIAAFLFVAPTSLPLVLARASLRVLSDCAVNLSLRRRLNRIARLFRGRGWRRRNGRRRRRA